MSETRTVVIDAGVGNLGNLARALRHLGAECEVTTDPEAVATGRCLVLPGVGAFRPPRENLRGALEDALRQALDGGAWLLGICVGYQLLFERGEEFGNTDGLGLLPGTVRRLPDGVPLPHIGWNRLHDERPHPLFAGVAAGSYFYFVHSFAPLDTDGSPRRGANVTSPRRGANVTSPRRGASVTSPRRGANVTSPRRGANVTSPRRGANVIPCLAQATHGASFAAVAGRGRVLGTQFHPERSGRAGLSLLANYLELACA